MEPKTSAWLLITSQTPRREKLHSQGVQGHPEQGTCRTRLPGTAALHTQGWCACHGHTMAWPVAGMVNHPAACRCTQKAATHPEKGPALFQSPQFSTRNTTAQI